MPETCNGGGTDNEKETVSHATNEAIIASFERIIKRLWIALVVSTAATVAAWLYVMVK